MEINKNENKNNKTKKVEINKNENKINKKKQQFYTHENILLNGLIKKARKYMNYYCYLILIKN